MIIFFKKTFYIANINDRSQVGNRDSEIAIIIEDKKHVKSRMNGVDVSNYFKLIPRISPFILIISFKIL
jgi:hypothetical protein